MPTNADNSQPDQAQGTLDLISRYQIESYQSSPDKLRQVAVSFTGSPRMHATDPERVLLIPDPFSKQGFIYEFRAVDMVYAEELPNVALTDGSMVAMARLWIRKGRTGLKIVPFYIEDTAHHLADMI